MIFAKINANILYSDKIENANCTIWEKKMQGPRHMIRQQAHNATKETQLCSVEQITRQWFNQLMKRMIMKVTNCR